LSQILFSSLVGAKKRKRANSNASESAHISGPSRSSQSPPPLGTRLSTPTIIESKKARKRRRRQERRQQETQERLQILHAPLPAHHSLPVPIWYGPQPTYYRPMAILPKELGGPQSIPFFSYSDGLHPISPLHVEEPPPSPGWVSSMAQAAESAAHGQAQQAQILEPEKQTLALPPLPRINTSSTAYPQSRISASHDAMPLPTIELTSTSPVHALPPKPPPEVTHAQIIGMKPDQDPNSKHGIFHIPVSTQDAGGPSKKKFYLPNPACTLVMEQLPKTHRTTEFINKWSKGACGAHPVHLSIDGQGGKALIEFATRELAHKAWGSPKLGSAYAGLKSHQLKGKPREDLIKVWWYRVDGVGAGSGVGEIEEGEIEGDAAAKELDIPPKKETKKERKARLAKEREQKRIKRELELRTQQETQVGVLPAQGDPRPVMPTPFFNPHQAPTMNAGLPTTVNHGIVPIGSPPFVSQLPSLPNRPPFYRAWNPSLQPTNGFGVYSDKASYGSSLLPNVNGCDTESIASSRGGSISPTRAEYQAASNLGNEDMEIDDGDMEIASPLIDVSSVASGSSSSLPPSVHHQPRSSLPAPPPSQSAIKANQKIWKPTPVLPRNVSAMPAQSQSLSSTNSSTASSTPSQAPSEPRAMKNPPTEPSYVKRLQSRQRELESKLELERTLANKDSGETSVTPMSRKASPVTEQVSSPASKQAMEDSLRALVLQSQRARTKTAVPNLPTNKQLPAVPPTEPQSQQIVVPSPLSDSRHSPFPSFSVASHSFSLDDLAVSFITQTIQTLKPQTQDSALPPPPPRVDVKTELAAKQKRLEQQIAESKELMAQFAEARTKQERGTIMALLKEKSRCVPFRHCVRMLGFSHKAKVSWYFPSFVALCVSGQRSQTMKHHRPFHPRLHRLLDRAHLLQSLRGSQ
jgi:hypothetical protein